MAMISDNPVNISLNMSLSNGTRHFQPSIEKQVERVFDLYVVPCILFGGTLGNILSFFVLLGSNASKMAVGIFLMTLSVTDISALWSGLATGWIFSVFHVYIPEYSDFWCKWSHGALYISLHFSSWILVLVSLDRFTAVFFPTQSRDWFSPLRAMLAILVTFISIIGLNAFPITTVRILEDESCNFEKRYAKFWESQWPWIDLVFYSLIPSIIIFTCNVCIINRLRQRRTRLGVKTSTADQSLEKILIAVSSLFFVTTFPCSIFFATQYQFSEKDVTDLIYTIMLYWSFLNNAVNFLLYVITSRNFRQTLCTPVRKCRQVCLKYSRNSNECLNWNGNERNSTTTYILDDSNRNHIESPDNVPLKACETSCL